MITLTCFVLRQLSSPTQTGANDNFKGLRTLFGSGTTSYRSAITWATISTFAGSITSLFLAETAAQNFLRSWCGSERACRVAAVCPAQLASRRTDSDARDVDRISCFHNHGLVGALVGAG
jgi:PiT family inorganic phosphate transporter